MIENYKWRDPRNAVAWAAACARLSLPFYDGGRLTDVIAAIEIAERYAAGEEIDANDAHVAAATAYAATAYAATANAAWAAANATNAATATANAAWAAANATNAANAAANAANAARAAVRASVSQAAVDQLQLSAIAVDLGLVFESETYFAAIAALAIGNIDWAREIAESS